MKNLLKNSEQFTIRTKVGKFDGHVFTPSNLSQEQKDVLFSHIYFIGLSAFIQNPSKEMEQDIYNHLFNEDKLYVVLNKAVAWGFGVPMEVENARAIAFLSTRDILTSAGTMCYISGICIDPAYQGRGIGRKLMEVALNNATYKVAALRTQNPVMKESFDKSIGGFSYPNGKTPPERILNIAIELSAILKTKEYEYETMVCKGVYGSCLYGIEPSSRSGMYDDKFNTINKQNGDSILCVKTL